MRVGFIIFPEFTPLDMIGPMEVFTRMPETEVLVLSKTLDAVPSATGLHMLPNGTLADCPHLDLICMPGGPGCGAVIEDGEVLAFLAERGPRARWVTSVCTGSLVLAAAGLLTGYRATTHWVSMDLLPLCGAIPVADRVVVDGNRITGAGVSSGIDMALKAVSLAFDEDTAREIQLRLEYAPNPPFACGAPREAPAAMVERVEASMAELIAERRGPMARAGARLRAK